MAPQTAAESPYGTKATSVALPVSLRAKDELAPFEHDQVSRLIAQLDNSPARVRSAVLKHIRANRQQYRA